MARLRRLLRHLTTTRHALRRAFPPRTLAAIERAVRAAEQGHTGEIRFAVEDALSLVSVLRGETVRMRAIELFARLHVWDTEGNNGVLVYVQLADRAVEIVADRGVTCRVAASEWTAICRELEAAFGQGEFERGSVDCIARIGALLRTHCPAAEPDANIDELSDRPYIA